MTGRSGFLRVGHTPTLIAALLYFDVSFRAWVLLGPIAPFLREEFGLSATQTGLITAIPLLGGSLFRPVMGLLGDRIGGRRAGLIGLVLTLVPLALAWRFASGPAHFYVLGFCQPPELYGWATKDMIEHAPVEMLRCRTRKLRRLYPMSAFDALLAPQQVSLFEP